MNQLFNTSSSFPSLSLSDLLYARDAFHYHLMSKKNVVATAVGLYRIRKDDDWPTKENASVPKKKGQKPRRTLFNSEIRPYSWPCLYVFVSEWEKEVALSGENPSDVVPKAIYLDNGKVVPICVIEARKQHYTEDFMVDKQKISPRNFFGPGSPVLNKDVQHIDRLSTIGCIVKDGERFYALTNKHAAGHSGTKLFSAKGFSEKEIGITSPKGIGKKIFKEVYGNFSSRLQYLQMDIGLIDLHDITEWKTAIPGIKEIENVLDLYDTNFSLQLIGSKVVGTSAVTGNIRGEIQGLFYRYKAVGGYEYLSDFLIGPETKGPNVEHIKEKENSNIGLNIHHGDSGTLLLIEHKEQEAGKPAELKYYPFAILWGKNEFIENKERKVQPYALATSLSATLNLLDLDFVKDINLDNDYVWGYVGHYLIGGKLSLAMKLLKSDKLKSFIDKNAALLTIDENSIVGSDPKVLVKDEVGNYNIDSPNFVALSDVPDNVWKNNVNFYQVKGEDGKMKRSGGPGSRGDFDNANHFADIDLPYKGFDSFLEFNLSDLKNNLTPAVWLEYYDSLKQKEKQWAALLGKDKGAPEYKHWGALPFRVQQLFNAMKKAVKEKKQDEFLCAAGVLIHYIGDACQPLHTSYLSQGDPDDVIDKPRSEGKKMRADGVHSGYEDDMVEYGYSEKDLSKSLDAAIKDQEKDEGEKIAPITTGFEAAKAVLLLAAATQKTIPPVDIVKKWTELAGTSKKDKKAAMWEAFGTGTIECMARGSRYLAKIWQGAWEAEHGDTKIGEGKKLKQEDIMSLYNDKNFVKSNRLNAYDLGE